MHDGLDKKKPPHLDHCVYKKYSSHKGITVVRTLRLKVARGEMLSLFPSVEFSRTVCCCRFHPRLKLSLSFPLMDTSGLTDLNVSHNRHTVLPAGHYYSLERDVSEAGRQRPVSLKVNKNVTRVYFPFYLRQIIKRVYVVMET